MIKAVATFAALFSLSAPAAAQERSCIPRADAQAAMLFALPRVVDAAKQTCGKLLPPTSFLNSRSAAYADRLRAENPDSWRSIGQVVALMAGDMPPGLTAETTAAMFGEIISGTLVKEIKPDSCPLVDQLAGSIAALPEKELANALTIILQLAVKPEKKGKPAPTICAAEPS